MKLQIDRSLFLFDVDGVLTDEHARIDAGVVALIVELAQRGGRIGFVTGRSRIWLETNLLVALSDTPGGPQLLVSAVYAAEMGAVRRGVGDEGWRIRTEFTVSDEVRSELRALLARSRFTDLVEWDATKEATATFEAIHRPQVDGHAARAREALAALFAAVEPVASAAGCRAALSTYALDVLAPTLSKAVGAGFVLNALASENSPQSTLVFGDSAGDASMATTALTRGFASVEFCWVGRGAPPALQDVRLRVAPMPHAAGTAAILDELLAAAV